METPSALIALTLAKTSSTTAGASPADGSSRISSCGIGDQGAADAQHLALAAGEGGGPLRQRRLEGGEGVQHPFQPVREVAAGDVGANLEVLPHGHIGEDVGELRHHVQPQLRNGVGAQTDQVVSRALSVAKDDLAAARRHQPVDRLQQGRFAAAVGPDHGDDGAGGDVDRNAVQHIFVAVAADEAAHRKDGIAPVHAFAVTAAPASGVPACVPR